MRAGESYFYRCDVFVLFVFWCLRFDGFLGFVLGLWGLLGFGWDCGGVAFAGFGFSRGHFGCVMGLRMRIGVRFKEVEVGDVGNRDALPHWVKGVKWHDIITTYTHIDVVESELGTMN